MKKKLLAGLVLLCVMFSVFALESDSYYGYITGTVMIETETGIPIAVTTEDDDRVVAITNAE